MSPSPTRSFGAVAFGGFLLLSACGGSSGDADTAGAPAATATVPAVPPDATSGDTDDDDDDDRAAPPTPEPSPLPAVDVLDVATGATVQFADLVPSDTPVLLWFWAPH